ncbi:MAG: hypothetical protein LC733_01080 [Actinobacteria bacterium]|nr:hypothetical protein [Actinomycetota bacterium]
MSAVGGEYPTHGDVVITVLRGPARRLASSAGGGDLRLIDEDQPEVIV